MKRLFGLLIIIALAFVAFHGPPVYTSDTESIAEMVISVDNNQDLNIVINPVMVAAPLFMDVAPIFGLNKAKSAIIDNQTAEWNAPYKITLGLYKLGTPLRFLPEIEIESGLNTNAMALSREVDYPLMFESKIITGNLL